MACEGLLLASTLGWVPRGLAMFLAIEVCAMLVPRSTMEMDGPGEASGKSGGSVESVGKDVQACDVCCEEGSGQVVLSALAVQEERTLGLGPIR